jgi:hypothetical protein
MPADGSQSTIVQGQANLPVCNAQRLLLEFYVYGSPPPGSPAGPFGLPPAVNSLPPEIAAKVISEVQANWECTAEVSNASGLRAQCWEAKNRKKNPYSCCDPTLIFRGSTPVYTDLAVYVRIDWLGLFTSFYDFCLLPNMQGVAPGQAPQTIYTDQGPITIPGNETQNQQSGVSLFGSQTQAGTVRDRVQKAGWEKFTIIEETRQVQAPSMAEGVPITLNLKLTVEIWAGPNGDWVNNFRQGWGVYSPLYDQGMKWAKAQVDRLQGQYDPPRVFFTGHSLGGGVASAAAQYCAYKFDGNKKLSLRGLTFNAAGLHPNTVAPGSTRAAPVFDYSVRDEILTTLQSRTHDMPLIGEIFRIANRKLPEAVTNITIRPGISGGGAPLPAAGAKLPALFPVSVQTAINPAPDWTALESLQGIMAASGTVLEVFQNLLNYLASTYGAEARDSSWTIVGMYQFMLKKYFAALQPGLTGAGTLFGWSTAYHLMPTVAETYYGKV